MKNVLTEDIHCDADSSDSASDADVVIKFHQMNEIANIDNVTISNVDTSENDKCCCLLM